jgi:hypothetical protein
MTNQASICGGFVHGNTIELDDDLGLPDGQGTTVTVQPVKPLGSSLPPGEGLRRAFGGWAEAPDKLDEYLRWSREHRKRGRPEIAP